jgi:hypothetical protein
MIAFRFHVLAPRRSLVTRQRCGHECAINMDAPDDATVPSVGPCMRLQPLPQAWRDGYAPIGSNGPTVGGGKRRPCVYPKRRLALQLSAGRSRHRSITSE